MDQWFYSWMHFQYRIKRKHFNDSTTNENNNNERSKHLCGPVTVIHSYVRIASHRYRYSTVLFDSINWHKNYFRWNDDNCSVWIYHFSICLHFQCSILNDFCFDIIKIITHVLLAIDNNSFLCFYIFFLLRI